MYSIDLSGRNAVVTGGAQGIGRAIACSFGQAGAHVILVDVNAAALEETANAMRKEGSSVTPRELDVRSLAGLDELFAGFESDCGPIDILVNNAGVNLDSPFLETSFEQWHKVLSVDLDAVFGWSQAAAHIMVKQHSGRIINLSSIAGLIGTENRSTYAAAKGGVVSFTKTIAVELARFGITANVIAPGAIETELVATMHTDRTRAIYQRRIPARQYGSPDDIAHAAVFLASDGARYITGHVLTVDGGFTAAGAMSEV